MEKNIKRFNLRVTFKSSFLSRKGRLSPRWIGAIIAPALKKIWIRLLKNEAPLFHFPNKDLFIELEREWLAATEVLDLCIDGTLATLEHVHSQREIFGRVLPKHGDHCVKVILPSIGPLD
jgi:hypothetical protein